MQHQNQTLLKQENLNTRILKDKPAIYKLTKVGVNPPKSTYVNLDPDESGQVQLQERKLCPRKKHQSIAIDIEDNLVLDTEL